MYSTRQADAASSIALTTRLVLLYLICTLIILFCTSWFQFRALSDDLELEENDFLAERLSSLRTIIARDPDTALMLKEQIQSNTPGQHLRYLIRALDGEGRVVLESPGMSELRLTQFPPPLSPKEQIGHGARYLGADSRSYLLNSAWAEGFGDAHFRLVQIALDVTDEDALIEKYRFKMGMSVSIGLLLSGALGYLTTRRGLQPLQKMAIKVAQITETDLHQRIRTGVWPRELDQLTIALDAMLGRLEDSFTRLSEFSANLAHELRTPINNLRGEAEVALSRARSEEEYRHTIESSIEEYERLSRMMGDILFLARPDQRLLPDQIEVRAEIETLAEYYRNLADEQQIAITIQGTASVTADPHLFQRAVGRRLGCAITREAVSAWPSSAPSCSCTAAASPSPANLGRVPWSR
jgi:two-component system heavy metal sensor histidine kinase CusS